jgi:hypothetical protein
VAPTRQPQAAAQTRGTGRLGLKRTLGWAGKACAGRVCSFPFFYFYFLFKTIKQNLNSNQDLNPNTKQRCTSMNATLNSYISLIN